jgi:hypothetical protein
MCRIQGKGGEENCLRGEVLFSHSRVRFPRRPSVVFRLSRSVFDVTQPHKISHTLISLETSYVVHDHDDHTTTCAVAAYKRR